MSRLSTGDLRHPRGFSIEILAGARQLHPALVACLALIGIFASTLRAQTNEERDARVEAILPALQKTLDQYRRATRTPGVAVAVVTPDNAWFLDSGRRRVSSPATVCECTAFQLASVSKAITGTYAARLVTLGRLDWNDRIVHFLPGFAFASPSVTRQVTVLDMLTQRSGLLAGTGNILEDLGYGQRTVLDSMRLIDPAPDFRETWAYVNFGITLGGVAAARTTAWPFPSSISRMLFQPLGMLRTTADYRQFLLQRNRAQMNYILDGRAEPRFVRDAQAQAPAGGVSSDTDDLSRLMQMYLNDGLVDGKPFLSRSAFERMISPITPINSFPDGSSVSYGVGWFVRIAKDGLRTVFHSGTFVGARTILSFRPAEKIGIVVLANATPGLPPEAIEDAFYQLYDTGRVKRHTLQTAIHNTLPPSSLAPLNRVIQSSPNLGAQVNGRPLSAYVGVYANSYFGPLAIAQTPDGLSLTGGPEQPAMPLRFNRSDSELYVLNRSGDFFKLEFRDFDGTRFATLHLPAADDVGWGFLKRAK